MYKNNRFRGRNRSQYQGNRHFSHQKSRFTSKGIDPKLFVRQAVNTQETEVVIENRFSDFDLQPVILERLLSLNFTKPTPIQDKTIAKALRNEDFIGLADTGTGKTLAFALPIINRILKNPNQTALIMAPTRELASQIKEVFRSLTEGFPIYSCLVIGGSNIQRQILQLKRRPHIIIGTPGRLLDLYERRAIRFDTTYSVVLDEMDRMLDMGFVKDITKLLSFLPQERHTMLFSATIDARVENIARQFMKEAEKISVKTGSTSQNVDQNVVKAYGDKIGILKGILRKDGSSKVIIFGKTKHGVEKLSLVLQKDGFNADSIHGGKRQSQREQVLRKFKDNKTSILIATDVAARGIDVKDISLVINYDQPATYEDYVHRIGRTGRAGKKGYALTFID